VAAFTGTPEEIYDGNDNVYWTGTAISGTLWSDSTNRANSGTKSLRFNSGSLNDTFQFDKGSNLTVSGFSAVTFAVNVNRRWSSNPNESVELYGWDTTLNAIVGNRVKIENYFQQNGNFDVWQNAAIPLTDMGLTGGTIDSFRLELVGIQGPTSPDFFIDDLQVEQAGEGIRFKAEPRGNTRFHVEEMALVLADAATGGLSYDKILALTALPRGITIRRYEDGVVKFAATVRQLSDLLLLGFKAEVHDDGVNTVLTLTTTFPQGILLSARDWLEVEVNDDLTGLLEFRATLRGAEEQV